MTIYALPNMQARFWTALVPAMAVVPGCAGRATTFAGSVAPAGSDYQWQWSFGDPAAGPSDNQATGAAVSHAYAAPGTYTVTLRVTQPGNPNVYTATQQVAVGAPPAVSLGARVQELCLGQPLLLSAAQPAPSTYRWQDGSTAPTLLVEQPGQYWVEVSRSGCSARDEVTVHAAPALVPNIITPNGDGQNDTFTLQGYCPGLWELTVYNRWGRQVYRQARYANTWAAAQQPDGVYYYLLRGAASGQLIRGYVQVVR